MRKTMVLILAAVMLLGAACGDDDDDGGEAAQAPAGAQTYDVDVDADVSPQYQVSAYFPGKITVRPGDTIVFTNKSKAHPHTVTLGIKPDQSNRPALVDDKGVENPVAFGPCFTDTEPSPQLTACPTPPNPASPPEFAGKGYWNSGIIATVGQASPKVSVKIADNTPPGDYSYLCMLHAFMVGTMTVADDDADRKAPAAVRTEATSASAAVAGKVGDLKPPAATPGTVTAGYGDRITAVNLYDPQTITVKSGDTVTWKTTSPYEPHTVTFQSPFKTPSDEGATAPAGVKSGGTYTAGFTSSGLFGPPPFFPSDTFSLTFTKAGTYNYVCTIHPGMTGAVTVT
jgi:plastocyanin